MSPFSNDAVPLGKGRLQSASLSCGPRRFRRRGPRNQIGVLRRAVPKHRRALPVSCLGESRHFEAESISNKSPQIHNTNFDSVASVAPAHHSLHDLCIYSINIQCSLAVAHFAELAISWTLSSRTWCVFKRRGWTLQQRQ